jgi:serine/threonine-protein kinase
MHDRVFRPGDLCGEYTITGLLGAGGFAEVYAGAHLTSGERVALKCLQLRHGENEYVMQRMLAEAELLATVDHQNLVQVVDFGKHGDVLYMVMELLEGHTLRDEIKQASQRMPLDRALFIALEIADGLDAAHERGVVHRDLKPDNVFLTKDGRVKVLDLGAGKFYGWGLTSTAPGLIVGTPLYMAPEHVKGGDVDGRTDIYALGVMIYEMCAEHPLAKRRHEGASKAEIALLQLQYEPPPLRVVTPDIPLYVSDIAAKAMAKKPDDRFGSMSELARALRHARGRYREELKAQSRDFVARGEEGQAPAPSAGSVGRPSAVKTPSTVMTPSIPRGGTDPLAPAASGGASTQEVASGRGGTDPLPSAAPVRMSAAPVLVTEAGTVRMSVPAAFGGRTEPLPSQPPDERRRSTSPEDRHSVAANGAHPGAGAREMGQDARATGMASSVTPPNGSPVVGRAARSAGHRQLALIVLGFGLGVLLMGMLMLLRDRNATASSPGDAADLPSAPASPSEPAPGAPAGTPLLSSEAQGPKPAAAAVPEPVMAAPEPSAAASAAPPAPEAKPSAGTKRPLTTKAVGAATSSGASAKAPTKPAVKPGRPKAEAPVLIFE